MNEDLNEDMNGLETDDPELKAALRRVWGDQAAPLQLRQRVERSLRDSADSAWKTSSPSSQIYRGWAIAASLLLSASLATWLLTSGTKMADAEDFPEQVALAMAKTHDRCSALADHHRLPDVKGDDYVAIGGILAAQFKIAVISTPVRGWQFAGASECKVGKHYTAHLLYRNGGSTLSIFSMCVRDYYAMHDEDEAYSTSVGSHYISGFVRDGGIYCVVVKESDRAVGQEQAKELRDQLQREFGARSYARVPANLNSHAVRVAIAVFMNSSD